MLFMLVTLLVLNPLTSKDVSLLQFQNMPPMPVTLLVLKWLTSKLVRELQ